MLASSKTLHPVLARRGLRPSLKEGYAELYESRGATHELTISLGLHPATFDPEREFKPLLKVVCRELTQRLRSIPKRQRRSLTPDDAVFMAGFYEAHDRFGLLFPHWHGVLALQPGEDTHAREVLAARIGVDETTDILARRNERDGDRTILTARSPTGPLRLKPSFHLQALTGSVGWVGYATKQVRGEDPTFWTTHDFLDR